MSYMILYFTKNKQTMSKKNEKIQLQLTVTCQTLIKQVTSNIINTHTIYNTYNFNLYCKITINL